VPTLFFIRGLRVHFYSREGSPLEPMHVHVTGPNARAKFWIQPDVRLAVASGLSARELRIIEGEIRANADRIREAWNAHFGH
jgi:hypothetical protein